jgi:dihydropteroate synthase
VFATSVTPIPAIPPTPSSGTPFVAPTPAVLECGRFRLSLARPLVMGILNVTPDSFSDGGRHASRDAALRHAERLVAEGADIIDIGGESTRPGAEPLPLDEELARVIPLVEALSVAGVPISVDTYKPEVMQAALSAGADMINDIRAMREPGAVDAVARGACAVCVMHMAGEPGTMQRNPQYADVVGEVRAFLDARVAVLLAAGLARERIVVDPGFGFGKTVAHNYALLAALNAACPDGVAILAGMSRKSMLGAVTGRAVDGRLHAGIAAAVCAVERGARIVRVHDVAATLDAMKVWSALDAERQARQQ